MYNHIVWYRRLLTCYVSNYSHASDAKHHPGTKLLKFNGQFYKQNEDLAMGTPTSAFLAETFVQCLEVKVKLSLYEAMDAHRVVRR
jgi:hypothetical protein